MKRAVGGTPLSLQDPAIHYFSSSILSQFVSSHNSQEAINNYIVLVMITLSSTSPICGGEGLKIKNATEGISCRHGLQARNRAFVGHRGYVHFLLGVVLFFAAVTDITVAEKVSSEAVVEGDDILNHVEKVSSEAIAEGDDILNHVSSLYGC